MPGLSGKQAFPILLRSELHTKTSIFLFVSFKLAINYYPKVRCTKLGAEGVINSFSVIKKLVQFFC